MLGIFAWAAMHSGVSLWTLTCQQCGSRREMMITMAWRGTHQVVELSQQGQMQVVGEKGIGGGSRFTN